MSLHSIKSFIKRKVKNRRIINILKTGGDTFAT